MASALQHFKDKNQGKSRKAHLARVLLDNNK